METWKQCNDHMFMKLPTPTIMSQYFESLPLQQITTIKGKVTLKVINNTLTEQYHIYLLTTKKNETPKITLNIQIMQQETKKNLTDIWYW